MNMDVNPTEKDDALRKLCTQLQEVRGEGDKAQAKIDALEQVLKLCLSHESELLRKISEACGDPDGKIRRDAVKVGDRVAVISTRDGMPATVSFLELR